MIPCQRALFDIPQDIAYFNCAYTAPLMRSAQSAGKAAIDAKATPWSIAPADFFKNLEDSRGLFGRLVESPADNIAIIPAASYGIALAAKNNAQQGATSARQVCFFAARDSPCTIRRRAIRAPSASEGSRTPRWRSDPWHVLSHRD